MDSVFWVTKRTHHAALGFCRPLLREFRLTPARYDLLFWLGEQEEVATQSALRHALGVARATISEMLAAIEKLGFVERTPCGHDRRTFEVTLTALGRALLNGAYEKWVHTGLVPVGIDGVMARFDVECDPYGERSRFGEACGRLRYFLGDRARAELYDDDVEEQIGCLTLPGHGSDGVPFVDEIVSVL